MSGYIIAQVKVHDPEEYEKYRSGFMDALQPFDGRILVATDSAEVLEGEWPQIRTVVLEFPSGDLAVAWYKSKQYQEIAQYRFLAARTNMILVNGYSLQ